MIAPIVFWSSLSTVAFSYVGFPALVLARGKLCPRPLQPSDSSPVAPSVSVVIAAYNEVDAIADKLRTVLAQEYDGELEAVVVSDGSTDGTVEAARSVGAGVTVIDGERMGKAGALNVGVAAASGDIVVFTDANSELAVDAVARLVAPFRDPAVGGVAGDQRYVGDDGDSTGERAYWNLDRLMKVAESDAGNVISATGALYAVRRELVGEVPEGVTDDFTVSTGVIEQGHRLVFASDAIAYEPTASELGHEYRRKMRVMTRGLRAVALRRSLLDPRRTGFYAVQLFCHKLLRRLSVVPLIIAGLSVIPMRRRGLFRLIWRAELLGAAALGGGLALSRTTYRSNPIVSLVSYFCMVNAAALHALFNVVTGRQIKRWTPQRENPA